ncbi:hypothetical protein BMW26_16840 [Microbacterium sp. 1.5R]|uniref:hypothetical protein n=1 Tax=unclassified Microbacterium TaxID=2609290 RepID=UPI0006F8BECF|nr:MULTISPECIES: hypothetical protein [unclassified Microbacterium]APH46422.1 hypothetical protein BMW26_16840 [Microbacterium sp. 1.5R]KRD53655.1 hypothetical protein ASE34_00660 [Microbacterium sp. Root280D1]CAH0216959.1 hypothetical protein SRABI98_02392 [Microbacterium sp. Bi98]
MSMESGLRRYADVFAASFRDAINARGLTLARLHEQLRARGNSVSMATLSYWRSGARRPEGAQSMAALGDIEQLLHLEPGSLTALLGTTNRTGPLGPNLFPLDEQELEDAVKEAFAALGAEYPDTSRELTTHSVTDVDAAGNVSYSITRSIVQSTVGTVASIPFLEMTPGISTPAPFIEAVAGGRIAARYSHPNGEVHGVLFELDVPLTAPSTAMVEWSVAYPPDYPPQRETGHAVARQTRELLVWTRFHPDALPDRIEERVETPDGSKITELSLEGRNSVHQVRRAFGPGLLGVAWSYADGR